MRTGFGAGLRRGVAVVLAVAALACCLGKPGASPIAPSTAAPPIAARVAVGAALIEQSPTARPLRSEPVIGPSGAAYYARAIETIQTGQRVLARNPELAGGELPDAPVDPATWVNIRLRMPKPTGDFLEITLLRPVEWLAEHLAQATALDGEYPRALAEARGTDCTSGSTTVCSVMPTVDPPELFPEMVEPITADSSTGSPWIFLTLHELEAVGSAEIVEVGPCPELEPVRGSCAGLPVRGSPPGCFGKRCETNGLWRWGRADKDPTKGRPAILQAAPHRFNRFVTAQQAVAERP